MYCPSCGTELMQEMSYCNRCGANLKAIVSQEESPAPRINVTGAAWAISIATAFITLGGFGLIFSMVLTMVTRGIPFTDEATAMVVVALLVIMMVDWLLIRQLSRVFQLKHDREEKKTPVLKKLELSGKPKRQLAAPFEPHASVTDHTTRTFEPVYRERDTQR